MTGPFFCCEDMRTQVEHACPQHPDRGQCPDQVVAYVPKYDEYGLWIRTGPDASANSFLSIGFCPWCGAQLPPSRRKDHWISEQPQQVGPE